MPAATADNPFVSAALAYIRRGWRVVPLTRAVSGKDKSGKSPDRKGWQNLRWTEAQAAAHWSSRRAGNIGLQTGASFVALDFDDPEVYRRWSQEHPEALNTYTVARTNAPPGRKHLYFGIPAGTAAPASASVQGRWDFLSVGKQVVAPPSVHHSGGTYRVALDVPLLPWRAAYIPPRSEPAAEPAPEPVEVFKPDAARLSEALATIPPDCCRNDWIAVGMALHSWGIKDGLVLWDRWSRGGQKYVRGEPAAVWKGFKAGAVGIGTLFAIAQRYGYRHRGKAPAFAYGRLPANMIRTGQCMGMAAADLAVLMAVAVTMNEQAGCCRLRHKTIAGYFGVDPRTIKRAVGRLVDRGLMLETRTGRASVYRWGLLSADGASVPHRTAEVSDGAFESFSDGAPVPHLQNIAHAREDVPVCSPSEPPLNASPNGCGAGPDSMTALPRAAIVVQKGR